MAITNPFVEHTSVEPPTPSVPEDYCGQIGDGGQIPTVIESDDDGRERCPYCGNWYEHIGMHWSRGSCDYPPTSMYKMELLRGLMFGDGSLNTGCKNPSVQTGVVNKRFLEWLNRELGWLVSGVLMQETCVGQAENVRTNLDVDTQPTDTFDIYRLQTKSHPQFECFERWYTDDGIVFPSDVPLTPTALKMWYVSDGGLHYGRKNPYILFSSVNEADRPETIISMLEDAGFDVTNSGHDFCLPTAQTDDFLEYIGSPPPGFEYKWATESRRVYEHLKNVRDRHYRTQTFEDDGTHELWTDETVLDVLYNDRGLGSTAIAETIGIDKWTVIEALCQFDLR